MKSRAGPNPISNVASGLPPSSIGLALISTPWSIKKASRPGSLKVGSVVAKEVPVLGCSRGEVVFSLAGGYVTGALKRPVMVSPWLWIAWTLPFRTSSLNSV